MIYLFLFVGVIFGLTIVSFFVQFKKNVTLFLLVLFAIILFSFLSFRSISSGSPDTFSHYKQFASIKECGSFNEAFAVLGLKRTFFLASDTLFYFLLWSIARFVGSYRLFLILCSAIISVCMSIFFYKNSDNPIFSFFLFITIGLFSFSMNATRQMLATSLCCSVFHCLFSKKHMWIYFFIALLSVFLHRAAIIFLFIPLLFFINTNDFKTLLFYIVFLLFVTFVSGVLADIFALLTTHNYSTESVTQFSGIGTFLIYGFIIFMPLFNKSVYSSLSGSKNNNCMFHICILGLIFFFLHYNINVIYERIHFFFLPAALIVIPFYCQKKNFGCAKHYLLISNIITLFCLILFTYRVFNSSLSNYSFSFEFF